jgi:predicted transcriptional regulator
MSIAALKKEVKKNIDKADERVLKMVNAMLLADQEEDWYDELSDDAKASIERGLDDIKNGRVISHEVVMKKYKKWLTK